MSDHATTCELLVRNGACTCEAGGAGGVDAGTAFGTWPDATSRLIYHDAMPALLSGTYTTSPTVDLGGGNGLARQWFPHLTTVDSDEAKRPDVVADVLTWQPAPGRRYDRVLLRYVLHYLADAQVEALLRHVATWHDGELLVIQFVNDDLAAKRANSVNETKHFRTEAQLLALLAPWSPQRRLALDYVVEPEFYRNRLGHPNPTGHPERVVAYTCRKAQPA